jgi:hypothetical protein
MIVQTAANGAQIIIGTISPAIMEIGGGQNPAAVGAVSQNQNSRPILNGGLQQINGSSEPVSPDENIATVNAVNVALTSPTGSSSSSSSMSPGPVKTTGSEMMSLTTAGTSSSLSVTSIPKLNPALPFLCEWTGCMKAFKTPKEVEKHAIGAHCPLGSDDIPCLWQRCDSMKRKRFSLMTHLQDRHCHPQVSLYVIYINAR